MENTKNIARELIEMARHDLEVREALLKEGKLSPGYNPDMERVHKKNAQRLEEIIDSIGYPTKSSVGEEASQAAWLIVQHAISLPLFMKRCYALISEAANEVSPQNFAYLHDRICYFEGRPQKFGTQFDARGMYPVEDKAEMIRLRRELQLAPHDEESIAEFMASVHKMNLHPHDQEFNRWRKQVGWI
ncbi:DUF6624 domain-containing protein [Flavobacterium ginsenosidimutans]|uniref:DUF6624 domain-containing protein n=1 Tax=Flavobacterium ginsenosidimutans TaxID=687844 RepID=UPI000DAB4628|nr:DUF6624 domain-containing protein [Flavobacterium ginsenosidimutans]KAF2328121.1 hypothetical protein DM444_20230 [Flavobacterium ginsenosidimutans]